MTFQYFPFSPSKNDPFTVLSVQHTWACNQLRTTPKRSLTRGPWTQLESTARSAAIAVALLVILDWAPTVDAQDPNSISVSLGQATWVNYAAIGIGALSNLLIGGYSAIATQIELSDMWTVRMYMYTVEHWWWGVASIAVTLAFAFSMVQLFTGSGNDVTVLFLSLQFSVTVFGYGIQSWVQKEYRRVAWLAWSGPSRTGMDLDDAEILRSSRRPYRSPRQLVLDERRINPVERFLNVLPMNWGKMHWADVGHVAKALCEARREGFPDREGNDTVSVYEVYDGQNLHRRSVLWGGPKQKLFKQRVSRSISMFKPSELEDIYTLRAGCRIRSEFVASGILGRNKGLEPHKLLCALANHHWRNMVEEISVWKPRSAKVRRSLCREYMRGGFSGLGEQYIEAAAELAILIEDVPQRKLVEWLKLSLEHEGMTSDLDQHLGTATVGKYRRFKYLASYAVTLTSLNVMGPSLCRADVTGACVMHFVGGDSQGWLDQVPDSEKGFLARRVSSEIAAYSRTDIEVDMVQCVGAYLGADVDMNRLLAYVYAVTLKVGGEDRAQLLDGLDRVVQHFRPHTHYSNKSVMQFLDFSYPCKWPSRQRFIAITPTLIGVALATYGDYYATAWGLFLTLLGVVLSAFKGVATNQVLVGPLKLHPLDLLLKMSPLSFMQCAFCAVMAGEYQEYKAEFNWTRFAIVVMVGNSAVAFAMNYVSFTANKLTSAVTMGVAANVKQALSIVLSVWLFNLAVNGTNIIGILITLAGGAWYTQVEYTERQAAQSLSKPPAIQSSTPPNGYSKSSPVVAGGARERSPVRGQLAEQNQSNSSSKTSLRDVIVVDERASDVLIEKHAS
ncbi:UAA transporter [Gonapodya sp. JEL0774]|nr:UAA transporter [Gonapodya sp. JEL0774]